MWLGGVLAGPTSEVRICPRAHGRLFCCGYVENAGNLDHRGRLVQDKATKRPKLNCRNWECGVVLTVADENSEQPDEDGITLPKLSNLEVFASNVPIPMQFPAEQYEVSRETPWFFGADRNGSL